MQINLLFVLFTAICPWVASSTCEGDPTCLADDVTNLMQIKQTIKHGRDNATDSQEEVAKRALLAPRRAALSPGPVTLYVMRHAEGCHNVEGGVLGFGHSFKGISGYLDPPLTTNGIVQANEAMKKVFRKMDRSMIDHVLSSPMRRAQQTAIMALRGTIFDTKPMRVAPFVNENAGGLVDTVENTPTSPKFQDCMFEKDTTYEDTAPLIVECNGWAAGGDTCDASNTHYSANAKASEPQKFLDWVTATYPNKKILLATHSNWAKDAGLKNPATGEKINWAAVYKVTLRPGEKIKEAMKGAEELYAGVDKKDEYMGESEGHVNDNADCKADAAFQEECKKLVTNYE